MSYAMSAALQEAVFTKLMGDAALTAVVGAHVYDALPKGRVPNLYVALGREKARDASDKTGYGAWHDFDISVVTETAGFSTAKEAAAAISDALLHADLPMSRGRLVTLTFHRATARRASGGTRRIDMTFRARVEDQQPT